MAGNEMGNKGRKLEQGRALLPIPSSRHPLITESPFHVVHLPGLECGGGSRFGFSRMVGDSVLPDDSGAEHASGAGWTARFRAVPGASRRRGDMEA
jgi:hypothetical protein